MGAALFYHLTRSPAESLVPVLIEKSLAQGWRVELRGTDTARLARHDDLLWTREGFLPHGRAGGPHDARQPVLLTLAGEGPAANAPACLIALDGAPVEAAECERLERTCILFDGADPAALDVARGQWRSLTAAGVTAEYWSDADGGWARQR
ncbi:DNA polymerase III subunit chi [Paracoccus sp. S-4012]|uniref:DNA polymerase III subunit chi n=1 Tax=Paracoccus sp. S-4012 TaxID=2665648 RepID=UPI0012AEEB49|nr:DNA polymerase III subunit chi [Paracoccus sp. S-4012]MRX51060.1 DNA polymerase III subunit chi [Paracoccus sp. S-4012]